ncbi:MAG TPA: interleukin-like EMT inducer domain-containing protein [Anaerolineae bacterium]
MIKRNWIVILAYLILTIGLTWPLVSQFGDHVPGTTSWALDEYTLVWNNWWFRHALFDLGANPFQTNFLFYPIGTSLIFYMYTLLNVVIGLPIQFLFGLIPASNAEMLFSFVMSGYGAFLLARYLLWSALERRDLATLAAFVAGALFAFSSNRMVYVSLGHYNIVSAEWVPFYILFLVKTVREPQWRNALLAGLFAALALYVELTYGVLLGLFTLLYLAFSWRAVWTRAVFSRLAVLGATAAALFSPLLVPTLNEIFTSGYSRPGWGDADKLVADLVGFFTPTTLNPLNRNWVQELDLVRQGISRFADVNTVFLGYATLALASIACVCYWKTIKVWVASAFVFAVLSLGPLLNINGKSLFDLDGLNITVPMPFLLLHYIPLLKENRTPNRFSVLVMLSLAVLVGFAIVWVFQKAEKLPQKVQGRTGRLPAAVCLLLLGLILLEHSALPLPLTDARIPDVYAQIGREPGDFAVLTLPLGWRNSFGQQGAEDTRTEYYQSATGKFYFGGNIERNSPFLFDYFDRVPLLHSLTQIEFYHDLPAADLARDKTAAPALMTFFDVRYVVINPSVPGRPPYTDTRAAVVEYIQKTLPLGDKIFDRDGVIAYRVNQAPLPAAQSISFGTEAAHIYQAEGWDRDETIAGASANWANRTSARVIFPVRDVSSYAVTVRALPFAYPHSPTQTMRVIANGRAIQNFDLQAGWADYTAIVPASELHAGLNDIVLQFGYIVQPRQVLLADYSIGQTKVTSSVDIEAQAGDLGSIKVNGREVSPLGRGYNLVSIDPRTGAVLNSRVFNTADDIAASRAMTEWLAQIPNGTIVAVASQGDASANLGDRTVAGLGTLGGQIDPRQNPTRSHVLIGVKRAAAGSALEQSNDGTSFVSVGHSPDVRTLAAAVSAVTIEKK